MAADAGRRPRFADRVDDIVVEFGNSLYQKSVDRYIAGEGVPFDQVRQAWRNVAGAVGPPSPVSEMFYKAVRDSNMRRRGKHQMRVVLGDPYADWDKIKDREDLGPFVANRDSWYATVVKEEVLARKHRAFLIMGWGHSCAGTVPAKSNEHFVTQGRKRTSSFSEPMRQAVTTNWIRVSTRCRVRRSSNWPAVGPAIYPRCRYSSEEWRPRRR